jgi:cobalt-zinc-cadmium efflux system outer membrane protein
MLGSRSVCFLAGLIVAAPQAAVAEERVDVAALLSSPPALAHWVQDHHTDVAAARARLGQARADTEASGLFQNPAVDATVSNYPLGKTNPPGLPLKDSLIVNVGLSQTFELGKRGPRVASAELREQASKEDLTTTLLESLADARSALAKVAWAHERAAILDESLAASHRGLTVERSRLEHGDMSGNDFRRLELDVTRAHAEVQAAELDCAAVLRARCDIGQGWAAALDAAELLPATLAPPAQAVADRPDLRSLALQQRSAETDAVLARRRAIPDVNVRLGYTQDQFTISGDMPRSLALTLTLPLPTFDHGQADEARAVARARELSVTHDGKLTALRAEAEGLIERSRTLDSTLARLTRDALPKSAAVLESTEQALHQGQVALTDLLLARRTHLGLRLSVLDLRFERFTIRSALRKDLALDAGLSGS